MSLPSEEEWRPVVGYEDRYEVSDRGRVRTVPRPGRPSLVRKPYLTKSGYWAVPLWRGSQGKNRLVHQIVADAFCERSEGQCLVRHLDDVKTNNSPSNLAWGDFSDNAQDAVRNGRNPFANKTHCKYGHEFSGRNLMIVRGNNRACRACTNERNRKTRERKKMQSGCTTPDCTTAPIARGLCNKHYLPVWRAERKASAQ